MKKALFIFFILTLVSVTATEAQNYNQYDTEGKRHGRWQKVFEGTNILRYKGTFNHGKEVGTFKFFKKIKGKAVLTATRTFNATNGQAKVTFYDTDGSIVSEGVMLGKLYIGVWKYYKANTKQLLIEEHYNTEGALDGKRTVYYKNGQIAEQNTYQSGKLEGEAFWYAKNGTLIKSYVYANGTLHGMAKFYDGSGNLKAEGRYKNDKKYGTWTYYENGRITEAKKY